MDSRRPAYYVNYSTQSHCSAPDQVSAAMRAIPIGQRVRTRLIAVAATVAVLITVAACTTGPGQNSGQSASQSPGQNSSHAQSQNREQGTGLVVATADGAVRGKAVAATDEFLG